mgnify:CR=1 FL=1
MADLVDKILKKIGKLRRIVVIGDAMVDRWVYGHTAQCQDGCPKFVQESVLEVPGGAANAEQCLSNWGVKTSLYGYTRNNCPIKCRYVEGGKIIFRADDDRLLRRSEGDWWARGLALEMVQSAGGVLLSDYDKGFLSPEFIINLINLCQKRDIPCVADMKRSPNIYSGAILKCNSGYQHNHDRELSELVYDSSTPHRLVVTDGPVNPIIWDGKEPLGLGYFLPPVKCVNHVGAGDCFAAHLVLGLAGGFSLKEAAALAHSAGRVYVQFPNNRPPQPQEIAADLSTALA